ncbi:hypothetical protein PInf_020199 [Phytophthora infestans]|nr:hypothetical protein PInf_020199 [Phytophthora infestans]
MDALRTEEDLDEEVADAQPRANIGSVRKTQKGNQKKPSGNDENRNVGRRKKQRGWGSYKSKTQNHKQNPANKKKGEDGDANKVIAALTQRKCSATETSLHRRATGAVPVDARKGRQAVLPTQDESGIVEVILLQSKHGLCMPDNELRILARRVEIEKHGTISDSFPSKKWSLRFVKRHGDVITQKRSQIHDAKRYDMSTE